MIIFKEIARDEEGIQSLRVCVLERALQGFEPSSAQLVSLATELGKTGAELPVCSVEETKHEAPMRVASPREVDAIEKQEAETRIIGGIFAGRWRGGRVIRYRRDSPGGVED